MVDGIDAVRNVAHHESWISELEVRHSGSDCGLVLWMDVEKDWLDLRLCAGARGRRCDLALSIQNDLKRKQRSNEVKKGLVGEPVAAVGHPPTDRKDGNRGDKAPKQGQQEIRDKPQTDEKNPEDFAAHVEISLTDEDGFTREIAEKEHRGHREEEEDRGLCVVRRLKFQVPVPLQKLVEIRYNA